MKVDLGEADCGHTKADDTPRVLMFFSGAAADFVLLEYDAE
jgi:hypothetical protein